MGRRLLYAKPCTCTTSVFGYYPIFVLMEIHGVCVCVHVCACRQQVGQPLPVAAAAQRDYTSALGAGLGDMDFAAIMQVVAAAAEQQKQ